ncbi:DUF3422 domain-containing protein [Alsobacter soli]|uniref:DUF3422 domain-containing protein n=2 Tax=Alsobacter soli TaxID=2109933 RepID=A0A2T1HP07_9HYPH|nr:DUF3422 domain-containing protein [Alsobacter soli]
MPTPFTDHPLRGRVLQELHARPFAPVGVPGRLVHLAFMAADGEAVAAAEALGRFCEGLGLPPPAAEARHHRVELSGLRLRWERHSEFLTYTWEQAQGAEQAELPAGEGRPARPEAILSAMRSLQTPGELIAAADVIVRRGELEAEALRAFFGTDQLAVSLFDDGTAAAATDFRPDAEGFVRIVAAGAALDPAQAGALVQRLLEVETYRTLALLGLPLAQSLGPALNGVERRLTGLLQDMAQEPDFNASREALNALTALAAELERDAAASLFRFSATRAYFELVQLRIEALREAPVPYAATWSGFLGRRLNPAIRTCAATEQRQDHLSRKLSRAAQLLRTRVDVELEGQNRDSLALMSDRLDLQLRLQRTVEGLSVAAITYYVASLIHLVLEGAHEEGLPVNPMAGTALSVPIVLALVALLVHRIRRRHTAK